MNNLRLVIEREFTTRIRKKAFWAMTFLMPLLMLFIGFVPTWISSIKEDKQQVAILDHTHRYERLFHNSEGYSFVTTAQPLDSLRYLRDTRRPPTRPYCY